MPGIVIRDDSVDGLVVQGIDYVEQIGRRVAARRGDAKQAIGVTYVLEDSYRRLHCLRAPAAIRYFSRETLAFLQGNLDSRTGLGLASREWLLLADQHGQINSNYGYLAFHERTVPETQFDWTVDLLATRPATRRALINMNQPRHKAPRDSPDFPCLIAAHFFTDDDCLHCLAYSRSEDVIWGLPYDIGFLALLLELTAVAIAERGGPEFALGTTAISATFTQIYERTAHVAEDIKARRDEIGTDSLAMPRVGSTEAVLRDARDQAASAPTTIWLYDHAQLPRPARSQDL